jgi:hypothetical protein
LASSLTLSRRFMLLNHDSACTFSLESLDFAL